MNPPIFTSPIEKARLWENSLNVHFPKLSFYPSKKFDTESELQSACQTRPISKKYGFG